MTIRSYERTYDFQGRESKIQFIGERNLMKKWTKAIAAVAAGAMLIPLAA